MSEQEYRNLQHSDPQKPEAILASRPGGQSGDLVILFMNDEGVQGLLSSEFELSGEASAAAGPVGRHASAGTDWKMNTEALSYSRHQRAVCRSRRGWRQDPAGQ